MATILCASLFFATSLGMNVVVFPLTLESRGISSSYIGLADAIELFAGMGAAFLLPKLSLRLPLFSLFVITAFIRSATVASMPFTSEYAEWVGLKLIIGFSGFFSFTIMQTWLTRYVANERRGFALGAFIATFSMGIAGGPFLLELIGARQGALPFQISAAIHLLTLIPLLFLRRGLTGKPEQQKLGDQGIWNIIKESPLPFCAQATCDFVYFGLMSFLVLYGVYNGLDESAAAFMITALLLGSMVTDIPIGMLSDHMDRRTIMNGCITGVLICALCFPFSIDYPIPRWINLFLWCTCLGGVYTSGMALLSQRYSGNSLTAASAAFSMVGSISGVIGTLTIGLAMDIWRPHGFTVMMCVVCTSYLITAIIMRKKRR